MSHRSVCYFSISFQDKCLFSCSVDGCHSLNPLMYSLQILPPCIHFSIGGESIMGRAWWLSEWDGMKWSGNIRQLPKESSVLQKAEYRWNLQSKRDTQETSPPVWSISKWWRREEVTQRQSGLFGRRCRATRTKILPKLFGCGFWSSVSFCHKPPAVRRWMILVFWDGGREKRWERRRVYREHQHTVAHKVP